MDNKENKFTKNIQKKKGEILIFVILAIMLIIMVACICVMVNISRTDESVPFNESLIDGNPSDAEIDELLESLGGDTVTVDTNTNTGKTEYNGILFFNTDINLDEKININIPTGFSEAFMHDNNRYKYEYIPEGKSTSDCEMMLSVVKGYASHSDLINGLAKYNSATETLNTEKINGIEWMTIIVNGNFDTKYYSATTQSGLVYLFEFSVDNDASEYLKYYKNILNSINFK